MVFKEKGRNKWKPSWHNNKASIYAIDSIHVYKLNLYSIVSNQKLPFSSQQYEAFTHRFSHHLLPVTDLIHHPFNRVGLPNFKTISTSIYLSHLWGFKCTRLPPPANWPVEPLRDVHWKCYVHSHNYLTFPSCTFLFQLFILS